MPLFQDVCETEALRKCLW